MFNHKWFFQGKVIKIINNQAVVIEVDLGFGVWKMVTVGFNRIRPKSYPALIENHSIDSPAVKFMEQNLKGKQIYCQIFKKNYNGINRYFAEIYTQAGDIPLKLMDINKNMSNSHRIDGYINFNDVMVSHGFSVYIQFKKDLINAKFPVYDRPPRQNPELRSNPGSSPIERNQTDSSRGGYSPEGQGNT
jgi:hypothetical protein